MSTRIAAVQESARTTGSGRAALAHGFSERNRLSRETSNVQGVVLAGAHSWRGDVLANGLPRSLWPIAGRPLIYHVLAWLRDAGIRDVSICANSQTDVMRKCLADDAPAGLNIGYFQDVAPRGPAGCVRDAAWESGSELLVAVEGSVVPRMNLHKILAAHKSSGALLTVVARRDAAALGSTDLLCPAGVYVFDKRVLQYIPVNGYQDIKEVLLPRLHAQGEEVASYVSDEAVGRVTDMESYLAVNSWLLDEAVASSKPAEGYARVGDALIHQTASLVSAVQLIGHVMVGPNSSVEQGVCIIGPTTIGAHCLVQRGATICRSSVWDGCILGSQSMVDHCVLTDETYVKDGNVYRNVLADEERRTSQRHWFANRSTSGSKITMRLTPMDEARCAVDK